MTDMQVTINKRIKSLLNAHANNLLEGVDIGDGMLRAILQRAKKPITDEEFVRQEVALWEQRYPDK